MTNQYEKYLQSLINWTNELEEKALTWGMPPSENWLQNIRSYRDELNHYVENNNLMDEQVIRQLKAQGEKLLQSVKGSNEGRRIPIGGHKLPALPYAYDALEPFISEEIMRLHHDVHHKSYVDGLNKAEKMIASISSNDPLLRHWMREQSFNGSGHFLHTLFWFNMSPKSKKRPSGNLLRQIEKDFGSFSKFKNLFTNAGDAVQGPGWVLLIWERPSKRLAIQSIEKHNMYALWDVIPLLVLDLWEHAYYLQYKTDKNKYIENWWNIVNWDEVEKRYNEVLK
jgi:superoxide dismutase, Fe-Mn family